MIALENSVIKTLHEAFEEASVGTQFTIDKPAIREQNGHIIIRHSGLPEEILIEPAVRILQTDIICVTNLDLGSLVSKGTLTEEERTELKSNLGKSARVLENDAIYHSSVSREQANAFARAALGIIESRLSTTPPAEPRPPADHPLTEQRI